MTTSIRDLLVLIAILGLALSAMRVGGVLASTTIFLIGLIVMLRTVAAIVGRNGEQISARGFVTPIFIYVAALAILSDTEFGTREPLLLTSQMLTRLRTGPFGGSAGAKAFEFMSVGHAVIAMSLGSLGAFFASSLQTTGTKEEDRGEPSVATKPPS